MARPRESGWFPHLPGSPPAALRAPAAPPFRKYPPIKPRTGSRALSFLDRCADRLDLGLHQTRGQVESQRIFRQQPGFAVEIDVVAVTLHAQPADFDDLW